MTDYKTFFREKEILSDNRDILCRIYNSESTVILSGNSRYPILFVLCGKAMLSSDTYTVLVPSSSIIAIDTSALYNIRCSIGTVILEYNPPERLSVYLRKNTIAFDMPYSSAVPIIPQLEEWIKSLLTGLSHGMIHTKEKRYEQCRELAEILTSYPPEILGELYIPFLACSLMSCKKCKNNA